MLLPLLLMLLETLQQPNPLARQPLFAELAVVLRGQLALVGSLLREHFSTEDTFPSPFHPSTLALSAMHPLELHVAADVGAID